ncbi:MAG: hypothetical protein KF753_17205 [Caldilineaceae bacterium]|nr:hypothetical protein [Caldilineaceae bacterium]
MNIQEDKPENVEVAELKAHYDFDYDRAKPNRFAARLAQEQLMVVLDPDIAVIFPTSEAVNEALRVLATAAQNLPTTNPKRRRKPRTAPPVPSGQE